MTSSAASDSASAAAPVAPSVTTPPRVFGTIAEFNPKSDNVSTYLERLELYFEANQVEEDRKVPTLLTVMGATTYDTLWSLLAPTPPQEKTFGELLEALRKHFDPEPLVIAERFRFYQRLQKQDESIADFIADLHRLSIKCEFGDFLDQALRDRFVCGIHSQAIQKKLLAEAKLTIQRAQEIALGMESTDKDSKDLKGPAAGDSGTRSAEATVYTTSSTKGTVKEKPCSRCGRRHAEKSCKFKDAICHRCGKRGHIAPVCRSGSPTSHVSKKTDRSYPSRKGRRGGTKWLETDFENQSVPLWTLQGDVPRPPILVDLTVNETPVKFELDTGAAVSVMGETMFRQLFSKLRLRRSPVRLRTYTGQYMKTIGEVSVHVAYRDKEPKTLTLVVVKGGGPALLGRDWLKHFVLDWGHIKTILRENNTLQELLSEFADVFRDELGTITPMEAKLVVPSTVTPKFHRPRPVPYALRPQVEQELDRLERVGVLERTDHSDWAAPVVTVPKKDGQGTNLRGLSSYDQPCP